MMYHRTTIILTALAMLATTAAPLTHAADGSGSDTQTHTNLSNTSLIDLTFNIYPALDSNIRTQFEAKFKDNEAGIAFVHDKLSIPKAPLQQSANNLKLTFDNKGKMRVADWHTLLNDVLFQANVKVKVSIIFKLTLDNKPVSFLDDARMTGDYLQKNASVIISPYTLTTKQKIGTIALLIVITLSIASYLGIGASEKTQDTPQKSTSLKKYNAKKKPRKTQIQPKVGKDLAHKEAVDDLGL